MNLLRANLLVTVLSICTLAVFTPVKADPPGQVDPTMARFVGYSKASTTADTSGVDGMHAICQAEFGQRARLCNSMEWWNTHHLVPDNRDPFENAWIQPVITQEYELSGGDIAMRDITGTQWVVGPTSQAATFGLTCRGWNEGDVNTFGGAVVSDTPAITGQNCGVDNLVTCCELK